MDTARLLVVDDSLTIRRALEFILKPRGFELEFAADGREALDRAASFHPDLVLLDYVLPDMRGPDVCSALEAVPSTAQTPIILVSAKGASIRQAYQDAPNVVSYITKPFKPQVVLSVVDNALARDGKPTETPPVAAPSPSVEPMPAAPAVDSAPPRSRPLLPEVRAATVEETFSALLGQLEDAVSSETRQEAPTPRTLARLGDPLRRAREQLREIGQHLGEDGVAPYRLRADGSFANIASTLLDTHRLLCEATMALAAAGAPGPELPLPPDAILVGPTGHEMHDALVRLAEDRREVLLIDHEFASLPWIVQLMQPQLLVVVAGASAELDAAVARIEGRPPGCIAITQDAEMDTAGWADFEIVHDLEAVTTALGRPNTDATEEPAVIGLEVVSL